MDWSEIFAITVGVVVIVMLVLDCHGPRGWAKLYERIGVVFCKCPRRAAERAAALLCECGECVVEGAKAWWRSRRQRQQRRRERRGRATDAGREGGESGIDDAHVDSEVRLPGDRPPTYRSDLPPPRYDGEGSVDTLPRYCDDEDDESEAESEEANWTRFPGRRSSDDASSRVVMEMTGDLADGHTRMMRWE